MPPIEVSVVVAAWKAEDSIADAVRSALLQDVAIEVLVIDDASPDRTADAARAVGDPRVRVVTIAQNGGPAGARNRAFDLAQGEWLAVLDSDDAMEPGRLRRLVDRARAANADLAIDNVRVVAEGEPDGLMFPSGALGRLGALDLARYIRANHPFAGAFNLGYAKPLLRRAFIEDHGLRYDPTLRIGEDYLLIAEALARGATCVLDDAAGYVYRKRSGSISARLGRRELAAMQAADEAFAGRHALDPPERAALAQRRRALARAAAFVGAIEHLKRRRIGAALALVATTPRSALIFRYPLNARLDRLRRRFARNPQDSRAGT